MAYTIPSDYYNKLATVESGNNLYAVNPMPGQTASGLYQFTKSTFEALGFNWSDRFNASTQNAAVQKLTSANANTLSNNGIGVNDESLYAAHFFGATGAVRVLSASDGTSLSNLFSSDVINANPFLKGMSVGDFKNWLAQKMGGTGTSNPNVAIGTVGAWGGGQTTAGSSTPAGTTSATASANPAPDGWFSFITNLFSFHMAARFSAVFVGILLVGLAIAALVLTNDISPSSIGKKVMTQ